MIQKFDISIVVDEGDSKDYEILNLAKIHEALQNLGYEVNLIQQVKWGEGASFGNSFFLKRILRG
jgi:hypothetical protein